MLRSFPALLVVLFAACGTPEVERGLKDSGYRDYSSANELTFVVFGDSGSGSSAQQKVGAGMARVCAGAGCDFALGLGDNIYDEGIASVYDAQLDPKFEVPYAAFGRFDFWMVPGNHDHHGSIDAAVDYTRYSDRWRMPYRHYAVPAMPPWLSLYGFDTTRLDPTQRADAEAALCDGGAWRLAFGHHPAASHGRHGGESEVIDELVPLFERCGVQVYFAGHDHHQEHISTPSFEQVIQGAAARLRAVPSPDPDPDDDRVQRFAASTLGFALVTATPETLEIRFYDADGVALYRSHLQQ